MLLENLKETGYAVFGFESDRTAASHRINAWISRRWPGLAGSFDQHHPLPQRVIRFFLKGLLVIASRQRWAFLRTALMSRPAATAHELDRYIDALPVAEVRLIGHSAGAIAATMVSRNPKVSSICCFGYPFKHPDRPSERYRTRHLAAVTKPLLIVQGTSDPYGNNAAHVAPLLPPSAQVVWLNCDHDYSSLGVADYDAVWTALTVSLGMGIGSSAATPA
jgi:hypothetical protein